jgi:hypothetical protein
LCPTLGRNRQCGDCDEDNQTDAGPLV